MSSRHIDKYVELIYFRNKMGKRGKSMALEVTGKKDLLEALYGSVGCEYLSDLRQPIWRRRALSAAKALPWRMYSPAQWAAAVEYITGEVVSFATEQEARDYLQRCR